MNIIVIGGSGLVGGNCMRHFNQHEGVSVIGTHYTYQAAGTVFYDTLNPDNPNNFDVKSFNPDVIVHCGALTHVDYCEDHEEESYQQTVTSTKNVLALCQQTGAKPVYISTDYLFEGKFGPYDEDARIAPLNVYGRHKLEAEQLIKAHSDDHIIVRITNVYGDEERGKNFVSRIVQQIMDGKTLELRLPVDQYATPINAYDVARSIYLLLKDGHKGIFHLASTDYMNRVQLTLRIIEHFPETKYNLYPLTTDTLSQKANRPLQSGMKAAKFLSLYPNFVFSTVDEYIQSLKEKI